jgi:hypothetical protein
MNVTFYECNLRGIALRMLEREREAEWNMRLNRVSDEMLTIANYYEKWLTLNDMVNGQHAFNDFCTEVGYSPSIPQVDMYWAVTELREVADKHAQRVVGDLEMFQRGKGN